MTTFDNVIAALTFAADKIAFVCAHVPQIIDVTLDPRVFQMFVRTAPEQIIEKQPIDGPITVFNPHVTIIVRRGRGML